VSRPRPEDGVKRSRYNACVLASGLAILLAVALAQEPATPPPPAGGSGAAGSRYHELLPDIGRIGAEAGAAVGVSRNPHGAGTGWDVGGFIDLPLARHRSGRLSYEILMALSGADGGVTGTRLRFLEVSPFALKYALTRFDSARLRPYVTAGLDVTLAVRDRAQVRAFGPEDAPPAGFGLAPSPHDSTLALGAHAGGGLQVRLSRGLSLDLEYRYLRAEDSQDLQAATAAVGFHW